MGENQNIITVLLAILPEILLEIRNNSSHDLRNVSAKTQQMSDQIEDSTPVVKRLKSQKTNRTTALVSNIEQDKLGKPLHKGIKEAAIDYIQKEMEIILRLLYYKDVNSLKSRESMYLLTQVYIIQLCLVCTVWLNVHSSIKITER